MPVRLIKPYLGQAANTLYWDTAANEGVLRATNIADDMIELADDYATGQRIVTGATANTSRNASVYVMNSATSQTLTLGQSGYWPVGTALTIVQMGVGSTTISGATGVTIFTSSGASTLTTGGPNYSVVVRKTGANSWMEVPPLAAASSNSAPAVYNFAPSRLLKWRAKLDQAVVGNGRAKLAIVGDSTSAGGGAGSGNGGMVGARNKAWPAQMGAMLRTAGYAATDENIMGDAGNPDSGVAAVTAYDPRIAFTGSWTRSVAGLGGQMFTSTTVGDTITFAPAISLDNIGWWYLQRNGDGQFTLSDSTGTLLTVNASNPTGALLRATVTRAKSNSPITLTHSGAGTLFVLGPDCYDTATAQIGIYNFSAFGITALTKAAAVNFWDPANALATFAPDLTLINLGINDQHANFPVSQVTANIQTIIAKAQASGDVVLIWHHPDGSPVFPALTDPYRAAYLSLAQSNNIPMVDWSERFGPYTTALQSMFYYDTVHGNMAMQRDEARSMLPLILP